MRQWLILYRKEMIEMWRNYKWVWVPLVFILIGVMQPVTTYFLPEILQTAGNMPEGTVIQIPIPSGGEVMAQTLGQYGVMGLLVLVLAMMTVVSGEISRGVAELILVKPVAYSRFITAKWAGMATLTTASFLLGYLGAWYYTEQLIGPVAIGSAVSSFLIYLLWLLFIASVTLLMSTLFVSIGATAFLTLGIAALMSILTSLFSQALLWSPSQLPNMAGQQLSSQLADTPLFAVVAVTLLSIAGCVALSVYALHRRNSLT